jgi:hypothetical protein
MKTRTFPIKTGLIALVIILIIGFFASCDEEEVKDPFVGTWQFKTGNTRASFSIYKESQYTISEIVVNGESWEEYTLEGEIDRIVLQTGINVNPQKEFAFYGLHVSDGTVLLVDSVYQSYWNGSEIAYNKFYNQVLFK